VSSRVDLDLGPATSPRAARRRQGVVAQLEHLFPAGDVDLTLRYGPVPAGSQPVAQWRVVPGPADPQFLLPVRPAAARRVLTSHNRLRGPKVRALRRGAALAVGPLAAALGERAVLRLTAPAGVLPAELDAAVITRHLLSTVPGAVSTAISLRSFSARAKPTVQLLDAAGHVLAFAKVSSDGATGARVQREAQLLHAIGERCSGTVRLPRVLATGRCGPHAYSVVEPLPHRARGLRPGDEATAMAGLARLQAAFGSPSATVGSTALWRELRDRAAAATRDLDHPVAAALDRLVAAVETRDGALELATGAFHGDWVPWNLATANGTLWVWDLEYGSEQAPVGLDALRWVFQVEHVLRGATTAAALDAARAAAPRLLPPLGADPAHTPTLLRLHLVEFVTTGLELLAAGRGLPHGVDAGTPAIMDRLAAA